MQIIDCARHTLVCSRNSRSLRAQLASSWLTGTQSELAVRLAYGEVTQKVLAKQPELAIGRHYRH